MKKTSIILICIIVALISGIIGFAIGLNLNINKNNNTNTTNTEQVENKEDSIIGTYKFNNWNGHEAIIALKKDKTMICPNGSGTWSMEEGKLYIDYEYTSYDYTTGKREPKIENIKQEVIIVENGLMYVGHFFEKVK